MILVYNFSCFPSPSFTMSAKRQQLPSPSTQRFNQRPKWQTSSSKNHLPRLTAIHGREVRRPSRTHHIQHQSRPQHPSSQDYPDSSPFSASRKAIMYHYVSHQTPTPAFLELTRPKSSSSPAPCSASASPDSRTLTSTAATPKVQPQENGTGSNKATTASE